MPRHQRGNPQASPGSQRQLRVGEFLRRSAVIVVAMAALSAPAYAEVCDKAAGEWWRTEHGPVWLLNIAHPPLVTWFIIGGTLLFVSTIKSSWPGYLLAVVPALFALLGLSDVLAPDEHVIPATWHEGCRSIPTDLFDAGFYFFFALLLAFTAWRKSRRPALR